jgi:uncharacterized protein (TIGR00251 family)
MSFDALALRDTPEGVILPVKAVPGASRDRIAGVLGDRLKVATSAPPEKGKANAAIAKFLARILNVGRRSVVHLRGATCPKKEFRIEGIDAQELRKRLEAIPPKP